MGWLRKKIKSYFELYDISDLTVGGNCGICGAYLPEDIFPKNWRWGLCDKCARKSL